MKTRHAAHIYVVSITAIVIVAHLSFVGNGSIASESSEDKSPMALGKRVAQNVLARPGGRVNALSLFMGRVDTYYQMVCARYGVLVFADATGDEELLDEMVKAYSPFLEGKLKPRHGHVDQNVFGIVPFELYRQTHNEQYLKIARNLADDEFAKTRKDGLSRYTRFWVDDMYMIGSLQTQAYKATGEIIYADRAANQLLAYCKELQQSNGLFHHTLKSRFFWGRGNGWAAASMTELLAALPDDHPKRSDVMDAYIKMMNGLVKNQDKTGMWHQLLDEPLSYMESSCTGMFVFALATGVRKGWLRGAVYENAAKRGWSALTDHVDADGNVTDVCVGTAGINYKRYYMNRPRKSGDFHGQAALLWAAAATHLLIR